jgi:hypothetical protein
MLRTIMASWTDTLLSRLAESDDLHVSPLREDGKTYGTPTWIWSVVVDGGLYARAYNGPASRWYRATLDHPDGRIRTGGMDCDVRFLPADAALGDRIDAAYREKYGTSRYLAAMIGERARAATVRIDPRSGTQ